MCRKSKVYGCTQGDVDNEGREHFVLFWKGQGQVKWCAQQFKAKRSDHPDVIWKKTEEEARAAAWKGRKTIGPSK